MTAPAGVPEFARALLDDAAMFPPGLAPLAEAVPAHRRHESAPYAGLVGPLVAFGALVVLILICRWVFSTKTRDERTARRLAALAVPRGGDYGLLVPIATVRTRADAEMLEAIRALSNLHGPLGARPVELPAPANGTAPVPINETAAPPLPGMPPLPVVPPAHTPTPARPGHSLWRRFLAASGKAGGS